MNNFENELKALDQEWNDFSSVEFGVNDGNYIATINTARVQPNTFSDELELFLELIVNAGEYKGRRIFIHRPLEDKKKWFLVKKDLRVLGIDIPSISKIENYLNQMLDAIVEVKVETKNYKNKKGENKSYQNYELISKLDNLMDVKGDEQVF
ncbi:hypothetical protein [Niallia endozanthoxylica]|uniref:Uncharacterized protein n=1 Tax=Niallia endozanthoxylica TaxID=2036016 RepID=A0A5J5GVT6_9BACI|nr:hypothetical protein [Niallia endozanthoxylica]KAA9012401.1 hypothetical protein F4V44_25745 [Niallia endozanthoxylica]